MAQTYTMDEAAARIGISAEEFKRRVRTDNEFKQLKSFRDGATLRFRTADIDELARTLGAASDPGLQLAKKTAPANPEPVTGDFLLPTDNSDDIPLSLSLDDSSITGLKKSGSDSDVRLEAGKKKKDGSGESGAITEEISLDLGGPSSGKTKAGGSSGKLVAPKAGGSIDGPKSGKVPVPTAGPDMTGDSSSEFELSLDSDSDSFELQLNTDSSEEIDLESSPTTGTPRGAKSGLNMSKPADSGVSLEKGKKPAAADDSDESLDFELSLEPESGPKAPAKKQTADSDSEFELTLDDDSGVTEGLAQSLKAEADKGDIFETDFEIPKLEDSDSEVAVADESGSEVVAIEGSDTDLENSDFDLALDDADVVAEDDESASQVVLMDDEEPAAGRRAGLVDEDEAAVVVEDDEEEMVAAGGPPASWTAFPVVMLALSLLIVFLGTLMGLEGARSIWGSGQTAKASAPIVEGIADVFGMAPTAAKK